MSRQMTDEEKKAFAEKMAASRVGKLPKIDESNPNVEKEALASGKPLYTEEEVRAMIDDAVKNAAPDKQVVSPDEFKSMQETIQSLQEQLNQKSQAARSTDDAEKVVLLFVSECADDNLAIFGPGGVYGQVTGKIGKVVVPKNEWSRFMNEANRYLMDQRMLIVVSGLDDDERELYGVNYKEGETLDGKAFTNILKFGRDLLNIFPKLCPPHQEMVARRCITAHNDGHPDALDRDLVVALNEVSRKAHEKLGDPLRKGAFIPIIEAMNSKEAQ